MRERARGKKKRFEGKKIKVRGERGSKGRGFVGTSRPKKINVVLLKTHHVARAGVFAAIPSHFDGASS